MGVNRSMKTALTFAAAVLSFSSLTGCIVAPVPEPVVAYRPAPPPPPVVVVRPPYYYYGPRHPYYGRRW